MLGSGEINSLVQFSQASFPPGEMAGKHQHKDLYEVFHVKSGSGEIRLNDKSIALRAGCTVNVEPGEYGCDLNLMRRFSP